MWFLLAACQSPVIVLDADPARDGGAGERGPEAVERRWHVAPARVTEALRYEEHVAPTAPRDAPTVVFAHGGLVGPDRYRWLGVHLASRGYRVVAPVHDADLAILDASNVRWVLDHLASRGLSGPRATGGHSLGGVIAAWAYDDDPRLDALFLLASFPAGDGPIDRTGPVLSLSGTTDGLSTVDEIEAGAARYPAAEVQLIDGMNHFAWTDDPTDAELGRDGPLERPLDEVRTDALTVLDGWLDASLEAR
jgi:pimeloyl-ACP methyl ester carboxylesterase